MSCVNGGDTVTPGNISGISFTGISLKSICYHVTPGICRPTTITGRIDTGLCRRCPGQSRGVSGRTGTHLMHRARKS